MATAAKQRKIEQDLGALLRALSERQPTSLADQYERELAQFTPYTVLEKVAVRKEQSPYLLASFANVLAAWYRNGLYTPEILLNRLLEMTTKGYPLMVRVAAVDALGLTGTHHSFVHDYLRSFAHSESNEGVRASAADALENLGTADDLEHLAVQ